MDKDMLLRAAAGFLAVFLPCMALYAAAREALAPTAPVVTPATLFYSAASRVPLVPAHLHPLVALVCGSIFLAIARRIWLRYSESSTVV